MDTRYACFMEVIYADTLLLINFAVNYFILLATAKIGALPLSRPRVALGAALGAAYAVASALPGLSALARPAFKLVFAVLLPLTAFGPSRRFPRAFVVFLAVSAAFGGAVYAVSLIGGAGGRFVPASPRVLILSFAVFYAAITVVFRRAGRRAELPLAEVRLLLDGKSVCLRALRDTGNSLSDPISGRPVLIAEREAVLPLFCGETAEHIARARSDNAADTFEKLRNIKGSSHFRLLPYSAVGVELSLLLAFRPESVEVDGRTNKGLVVAISPTALSPDGAYSALIGGE